jgi:hypothetical protein
LLLWIGLPSVLAPFPGGRFGPAGSWMRPFTWTRPCQAWRAVASPPPGRSPRFTRAWPGATQARPSRDGRDDPGKAPADDRALARAHRRGPAGDCPEGPGSAARAESFAPVATESATRGCVCAGRWCASSRSVGTGSCAGGAGRSRRATRFGSGARRGPRPLGWGTGPCRCDSRGRDGRIARGWCRAPASFPRDAGGEHDPGDEEHDDDSEDQVAAGHAVTSPMSVPISATMTSAVRAATPGSCWPA